MAIAAVARPQPIPCTLRSRRIASTGAQTNATVVATITTMPDRMTLRSPAASTIVPEITREQSDITENMPMTRLASKLLPPSCLT